MAPEDATLAVSYGGGYNERVGFSRLGARMLIAAFAGLCAPGPALALSASDRFAQQTRETCESAYLASYEKDWAVGRERWRAGCREEPSAPNVLRKAQQASMSACRARFAAAAKVRKLEIQVDTLCSQGERGRTRLAAILDMPAEAPPPKKHPEKAFALLDAPMGPVAEALKIVRARWKEDACLASILYSYELVAVQSEEELQRLCAQGGRGGGSMQYEASDRYTYLFHSEEDPRGTFDVGYSEGDHDVCQPHKGKELKPSEVAGKKESVAGSCLAGVKVELSQALRAANNAGIIILPTPLKVTARLTVFSKGYLTQRYGEDASWGRAALRRAEGRPVWCVTDADRTAIMDAVTGKVLAVGDGDLALHP